MTSVYFEFDKSKLNSESLIFRVSKQIFWEIIPLQKFLIEGYIDKRGTREYNSALGARRAAAVRDF